MAKEKEDLSDAIKEALGFSKVDDDDAKSGIDEMAQAIADAIEAYVETKLDGHVSETHDD